MREQYFITGTGEGLGKSLAEELTKEFSVTGISRKNSITHPNFQFIQLDLLDQHAVSEFQFPLDPEADKIVLINNAGTIGPLKRMGNQQSTEIRDTVQINLIAVATLINTFLSQTKALSCKKLIVNISSGAALNPVGSWAMYCASKAGLDMLTRVLNTELSEEKNDSVKIYSVHPGIVDTAMQKTIRSASESDFHSKERFTAYHKDGKLADSRLTALEIIRKFRGFNWPEEEIFRINLKN